MPDAREIPELTNELVELSKQYLKEQTLEPAKQLGRTFGMSLLAASLFAGGGVLIVVGTMRLLRESLPESQLWSAFAVLVTALLTLIVAGMIMYRAIRIDPAQLERKRGR